ncbi:hypothetical protein [Vibrio neptunius]|uniref:Uncharacterized protein n=1 Tax=Vibrio neptunius TaxID=170651 RepID=A0ABS3A776_9VIBR|nr:hypothetical protein [Vibrio neptunius]MBN3494814.1 hypothetical protein [Vibrio neptunius]MBN3517180.1 hypothetical protein [Vibrio neptunius]MBN3551633.1 hypothetical protein [Vibrio neptunius]MBN3579699.1 hypothetical protein [Vibrio neptunius]MCH9873364.1 hypothetical protein [Vibrio neptunius]
MKLRRLLLALIINVVCVPTVYAHPLIVSEDGRLNRTLCQDDEDIYFNAQLKNGKIASLCAYQHYSPDTGYVKYRYGDVGSVELEFPSDNKPPRGRFLTYHTRLSPSVQGHFIYFYINDYRYLLISSKNSVCSVNVDDVSSNKSASLFRERCGKESWLKGKKFTSGLLLDEAEVYEKFPKQSQDPIEPQFHSP